MCVSTSVNTTPKERKESTQKDKTVETLNRRREKRRGEKWQVKAVACFPHIRTTSIDDEDDDDKEEEEEEEEEGAFREGGGIDGDVGDDDDDEDGVLFGFYLFCRPSSAMIWHIL